MSKSDIRFTSDPMPVLQDLKDRKAKTIFRKAYRKGSAELRKDLKKRVPVRTGTLKKSIGNKVAQKNTKTTAIVGPRKDITSTLDGKPVTPWRYFHLIDQGTDHIEPKEYTQKTWQSKGQTFRDTVDEVCQKEYKKHFGV